MNFSLIDAGKPEFLFIRMIQKRQQLENDYAIKDFPSMELDEEVDIN